MKVLSFALVVLAAGSGPAYADHAATRVAGDVAATAMHAKRMPADLAPAAQATGTRGPAPAGATAWIEQKVTASDGVSGDQLGWSVAMDGDWALLGAFQTAIEGDFARGAVYVFKRTDGVWTETQKLVASDGTTGTVFGTSVAIDGSTAVIGSEATVNGVQRSGAAYVFTESGGVWTETQKLVGDDSAAQDRFSVSVAIDGDTLLAASHVAAAGTTPSAGKVYVFTRSGGVWSQTAKLTASDAASGDLFGLFMALDGDTAIIGANGASVDGNGNQGAAYVFNGAGANWTETQKLVASDGPSGSDYFYFGSSVAIDGGTALIGARLADIDDDPNISGHGAVYVFRESGGVWTESQKLTASDAAGAEQFGSSVALDGDRAIVGAPYARINGQNWRGSAYVFTESGGSWTETQKFTASDGGAMNQYGWMVAARGDSFLVGAVRALGYQGAGYFYEPDVTWTVVPEAGPGGFIAPDTPQTVNDGDTASFTLEPDAGYHIESVGGTCGGELVDVVYTTAPITADCTVEANFAADTFTVTPEAGPGGFIAPDTPQTVNAGDTVMFGLEPDAGYHIDFVGGTCGGELIDVVYTTAPITADCTVEAHFAPDTFTVTPEAGPGGFIAPDTPQAVNAGDTVSFTLEPDAGFRIGKVGGTCGGELVDIVFTTKPVGADCTVEATFIADTAIVTPSAGPHGTIAPDTPQAVAGGTSVSFTVEADSGYLIDAVGGTCGGKLAGNVYTTAPVLADCTVEASFVLDESDIIFRGGFEPPPPVTEAWVARHDGFAAVDEGKAIAIDPTGAIYVAGYSVVVPGDNQYVTIKYAPDGTELWTAVWDDPAGRWDEAYGIAVDADGNAYVVGRSWGANGYFDAVTIKYDASGVEQWVRRSSIADYAKSIAVGPDGGIYVAGIQGIDTYVAIKYDADGNELWTRTYEDAFGAEPNVGNKLSVTPDGAIYLGGGVWSAEFGTDGIDYLLIRYDADGNEIWARRTYVDTAYALGIDMKTDAAGHVFMAGGSDDYRVLKFNADGDVLWDVSAGGIEGGAIAGLAIDAQGNVLAAGVLGCGNGIGCPSVVKFDKDGEIRWTATNAGASGLANAYNAVVVDAQGHAHVTGFLERPNSITRDMLTAEYTETGDELWVQIYEAPKNPIGDSEGLAIAIDGNGGTCVTGRSAGGVNETSTELDILTIKYASAP
jgi:hypothetical protein